MFSDSPSPELSDYLLPAPFRVCVVRENENRYGFLRAEPVLGNVVRKLYAHGSDRGPGINGKPH